MKIFGWDSYFGEMRNLKGNEKVYSFTNVTVFFDENKHSYSKIY